MFTLRIVNDSEKSIQNFEIGQTYSIYTNGSKMFDKFYGGQSKEIKAFLVDEKGISYPILSNDDRLLYVMSDSGKTFEKL